MKTIRHYLPTYPLKQTAAIMSVADNSAAARGKKKKCIDMVPGNRRIKVRLNNGII